MPLTTTTKETRKIIKGARCVSRHYPGGCPHKEGTNLLLAFEKPNGGGMQPYAHARVMALATLPMGTRVKPGLGSSMAEGEGYDDVESWAHHFRGMYGNISDSAEVTRLQLTVRLLDGDQPADERAPAEGTGVQKVEVKTKTLGSVADLDAVAELESQMFGGA